MIPEIAIVLIVPPLLSHYPLGEDQRDEKVGKYCGDGFLQYGDEEVSESWGRGEGRTSSMAGEVVKAVLLDHPDHLDQQKCRTNNGQLWSLHIECTSGFVR